MAGRAETLWRSAATSWSLSIAITTEASEEDFLHIVMSTRAPTSSGSKPAPSDHLGVPAGGLRKCTAWMVMHFIVKRHFKKAGLGTKSTEEPHLADSCYTLVCFFLSLALNPTACKVY